MWLIRQEVAQEMARQLEVGLAPTAQQQAEFVARCQAEMAANGAPKNLKIAGDVAEIRVEGVLTPKPDFWAWLFYGNTTYEQIITSIALAEADPAVKRVVFYVDSPGGHVSGLFDVFSAIQSMTKPKMAVAAYACSAAYGIAAATGGKIEATNAAVEVGSVGVAVTYFHIPEFIDITSTEAPDKRPDPSTEEGRAVIRKHLDSIHELFAEVIATGRGTTVERVNAEFGRGAVLLAGEAKKRGMIDKIQKPTLRAVNITQQGSDLSSLARGYTHQAASNAPLPSPPGAPRTVGLKDVSAQPRGEAPAVSASTTAEGDAPPADSNPPAPPAPKQEQTMDLSTLKAQHPDLYSAVLREGKEQAKAENKAETEAAVNAALTEERDRVNAHLTAGESSGDMKTAIAAIKNGDKMTSTLLTQYTMAAANRADRSLRQQESDEAGAAADNAKPQETENGGIEAVAAALDRIEAGDL